MGLIGWLGWMSEEKDKLMLLRDMTTDERQLEVIDKMIADLEEKELELKK